MSKYEKNKNIGHVYRLAKCTSKCLLNMWSYWQKRFNNWCKEESFTLVYYSSGPTTQIAHYIPWVSLHAL